LRSRPAGPARPARLARAEGLRIEVSDQGEILSEQQRETLFDFLTNERINNASLNMALARRIIEQHGGQILVMAAPVAGTIVQMNLPI
jgi:nitrogen-specific signal transduction histidine kinase